MRTPDPMATPRLHGWRHPAVLSAAALSLAAGFAQFGATAALGDIARAFGEVSDTGTIAEQAGLSGTTLGLGLALIRLASLASLPLSGSADHLGRRRVLLWCVAGGLALTASAAAAPGFWWFVVAFALARPLLSATNAVAGVVAAEETPSADRAKALALITAGYGFGAGMTALLRGLGDGAVGFRLLFLLAVVPLVCVPLIGRVLEEPERFERLQRATGGGRLPRRHLLADLFGPALRKRLVVLALLTFSISAVAGPLVGYLFVYGENVLRMPSSTIAVAVFAAAPIGLLGLLTGRYTADVVGRRLTGAVTQVIIGISAIITYSGSPGAVVGGYLLNIFAASAFAPATGALSTELFPTSLRATAAGVLTCAGVLGGVLGLLGFGLLVDVFDGFDVAAIVVALPVMAASALFVLLPETRGMELEESAPEAAV
jgi:putative MFS transporter